MRRRSRRERAFTLLEIMTVVTIIGILVTVATPSIGRQLRNRRSNQAAHEVSILYRSARARAMGRGAAVLVRYSASATGRGKVELFEAINPGTAVGNGQLQGLPATSCANTSWTAGNGDTRSVSSFDPSMYGSYDNVKMRFLDSGERTTADICFSPLGRAYIRYANAGAFTPMAQVPWVEVAPVDGVGKTKDVLVLPNGASRLVL